MKMQLKQTIILLILLFFYLIGFPQESDKYKLFEHSSYDFPYILSKPTNSWELPKSLVEISGLSYIDKHRLACVQDEKGNIYIFNTETGDIERKIDFGNDGDYEGIEIINKDAWILKSNGTLYKVSNFMNDAETEVNKYTTVLSGKNDSEGLAYDPVNNNLLIACKGHPFVDDKKGKEFKAIYSFDPETKQLDIKPFLLIEMDTVKYYKDYNTMTELGVEFLALLDESKGDVSFQPSGIAIHPLTSNIYILASVGNILIVFNRNGVMMAMIKLRLKYYPKPEGICFGPDGTLYISSEGDGEEGTILEIEINK